MQAPSHANDNDPIWAENTRHRNAVERATRHQFGNSGVDITEMAFRIQDAFKAMTDVERNHE
jgi:hypothetical protein